MFLSGEAIYTPEEECHYPLLTLGETLDFALQCKTPGNRLPGESPKEFRARMTKLLTTMFGLQKQIDTWVGDEYIRGLSGGEKKRLTLMEAMVAQASITCWDNSTRGMSFPPRAMSQELLLTVVFQVLMLLLPMIIVNVSEL